MSMADIEKALIKKERIDSRAKLPTKYHEFLDVFDSERSDKLPFLKPRVDHRIKIETEPDGRQKELP
jgi:hypothetical protein